MAKRFEELGIPVKLTRDSDETLPRQERIDRILNAFGNRDDVILISNHINAVGGDGAEVVVKAVANYIGIPYVAPGEKKDTYTVKKGDSLYSIAKNLGISVEDLKNANGISGNLINIGQVLTIPSAKDKTPGDYIVHTTKMNSLLRDN